MKYPILIYIFLSFLAANAFATSFLPLFPGGTDPGIPTHISVTGIYWNPAVIGRLKGNSVYLSLSPVSQSSEINRYSVSSDDGLYSPAGDLSFNTVKLTDTYLDFFVGATTDFGTDKISMGIAVYSPFRQYMDTSSHALRYHLVKRDVLNVFISPVVAIKLNRKFHIGFGLSYVYTRANIDITRDLYLRGEQPASGSESYEAGGINDEEVKIDASDNNLGFNAGFLWKVKKWLYFAGSYRSQIRSVDSPSINASGTGSITGFYDSSGYVTRYGNSKYITQFPDSASFGANMRLSKNWWGDFTLHYIRYSVVKNTKIVLSGGDFLGSDFTNWDLNITEYSGMKDVYSPQFTFFYSPYSGFSVILSGRYSPPATEKKWIRASYIDNHAFDFLFSTGFNIYKNLKFKLSYAFEFMIPADVRDSGFDPTLATSCLESHVDIVWGEGCKAASEGQALPTAAAKYKKYIHQLGFALEFKF